MKKILLVEDDKHIAAALAIRLRAAGFEVVTARNGLKGLKSAVVQKPALIVSDIWTPHPIGFLSRERMHNLGIGGVPVIYITASKKADLRRIAMEEGAAAFFEKPYDAGELIVCITDILDRTNIASAVAPAPRNGMKQILVIDDDQAIVTALTIRLRAAGYGVSIARDGLEGLNAALSSKPDLILMDVWMPGGVGFLVAERLKTLGLAEVPVIFLTAGKKEQLWNIAQEVEPAGFFEKPYEPKELLKFIARILDGKPAGEFQMA